MKQFTGMLIALLLSITAQAQSIKLFDCVKVEEDSSSATYSVRARFDSSVHDDKQRRNIVKAELEKNHGIAHDKISSLTPYMDKYANRFSYRVKVAKK